MVRLLKAREVLALTVLVLLLAVVPTTVKQFSTVSDSEGLLL